MEGGLRIVDGGGKGDRKVVVGPMALGLTPLSWLLPWISRLSYLASSHILPGASNSESHQSTGGL